MTSATNIAKHLWNNSYFMVAVIVGLPIVVMTGTVLDSSIVFPDEWEYKHLGQVIWNDDFFTNIAGRGIQRLNAIVLGGLLEVFNAVDAIRISRFINLVAFASAAIPTYLMTVYVIERKAYGYSAALLAVIVPWITISTTILPGSLAYPLHMWAVYAILRSVTRPSVATDISAFLIIAIAVVARSQVVYLFVIWLMAVIIFEFRTAFIAEFNKSARPLVKALKSAVSKHLIPAGLVCLIVAATVATIVTGQREYVEEQTIGRYASSINLLGSGVIKNYFSYMLFLTIGTGALPMIYAISWVIYRQIRPGNKREYAASTIIGLLIVLLPFVVSAAQGGYAGIAIEGRYVMYAVPVLMVGMVLGINIGKRLVGYVVAMGVLTVPLFAFISVVTPVSGAFFIVSPATAAYNKVTVTRAEQLLNMFHLPSFIAPTAIIAAVVIFTILVSAFLLNRYRSIVVLGVITCTLFIYQAAETGYVINSQRASFAGLSDPEHKATLKWFDETAAQNDKTGFLVLNTTFPDGLKARWLEKIMAVQFWNRNIDDLLYVSNITEPGEAFIHPTYKIVDGNVNKASGAIDGALDSWSGLLIETRNNPRLGLTGEVKAVSPDKNYEALLIDDDHPLRARYMTFGLDDNGKIRSDRIKIRLYGETACRRITLSFYHPIQDSLNIAISVADRPLPVTERTKQNVTKATTRFCGPSSRRQRTTDVKVNVRQSKRAKGNKFGKDLLLERVSVVNE